MATPFLIVGETSPRAPTTSVTGTAATWRGTSMNQRAFATLRTQTFQGRGNGRFPLIAGGGPRVGAARGTIDAHFRMGTGADTVVLIQSVYSSTTAPLITLGVNASGQVVGSIQDIGGTTVAAWEATTHNTVAATGTIHLQLAWDSGAAIDGSFHVWVTANGEVVRQSSFTTPPVNSWAPFQGLYLTTGKFCETGFDGEMLLTQGSALAPAFVHRVIRPTEVESSTLSMPAPVIQLSGAITPVLAFTSTVTLPTVQLSGAVTPAVSLASGALTLPSLQLSGGLAVLTSVVTAWYRMAASTAVSGEWQTIVDVFGGASLVQNDTDRRLAAGTSANGLPTGTYDGTDVMRMPLGANNFNTSKFGLAYWLFTTGLSGGQNFFAMYNNDAGLRVMTLANQATGRVALSLFIGTNVDGRDYVSANGAYANGWNFLRLQLDMTKTAECDTDGLTVDAKVRVFVNEVAVGLTATSFGVGGTLTTLRTPVGSAIFGAVNDTDTPSGPTVGCVHGPNTYVLLATPTAAQGLALMQFETPT